MQGLGHGLRPLQLFGGVVEEESLFAEVKLLKTIKKDNVFVTLKTVSHQSSKLKRRQD